MKRRSKRAATSCRRMMASMDIAITVPPVTSAAITTIHVIASTTPKLLVISGAEDLAHHEGAGHLRDGAVNQHLAAGWFIDEPAHVIRALHHDDGGDEHGQNAEH